MAQLVDKSGVTVFDGTIVGGGGGGVLLENTVRLSPADILALNTTPIEVVPPPDAGFAVVVAGLAASVIYGTADYLLAAAVVLVVNPLADTLQWVNVTTVIATSNSGFYALTAGPSSTVDPALLDGLGVHLYALSADPTNGDSDVILTITYYVVPVV